MANLKKVLLLLPALLLGLLLFSQAPQLLVATIAGVWRKSTLF